MRQVKYLDHIQDNLYNNISFSTSVIIYLLMSSKLSQKRNIRLTCTLKNDKFHVTCSLPVLKFLKRRKNEEHQYLYL